MNSIREVKMVEALAVIATLCVVSIASAQPHPVLTFFGPETFVRDPGIPVTYEREVITTGYEETFILHLRNGKENGKNRISAARVWIDEEILFDTHHFSQMEAGYDVPVKLTSPSILKVWVASGPPGELTIWMEGNPILDLTLDETRAVSEVITEEGGAIATTSVQGIQYTVAFPPYSLLDPEEITMTPISAIGQFPLVWDPACGVDFSPDGLELMQAATLTVELPSVPDLQDFLVGFCYRSNGAGFHLFPVLQDGTALTFLLTHLSGYGAGDGSEGDIEAILETVAANKKDQWIQEMAAIYVESGGDYTEDDIVSLRNILGQWFNDLVLPKLGEAAACASVQCPLSEFEQELNGALLEYANWWVLVQQYGLNDDTVIQLMRDEFRALVESELGDIIIVYSSDCAESNDLCGEKWSMTRALLRLMDLVIRLDLSMQTPDIREVCGGVLEVVADTVEIAEGNQQIEKCETVQLSATVKNAFGEEPAAFPHMSAMVWTSSNPSVAYVGPESGRVESKTVGTAQIRASVTQCDQTSVDEVTVTVVDETAPVIECPPDRTLQTDENGQATYEGPPATATDECGPDPQVTSEPSLPAIFPEPGTYTIRWTAKDASGNTDHCEQEITVEDEPRGYLVTWSAHATGSAEGHGSSGCQTWDHNHSHSATWQGSAVYDPDAECGEQVTSFSTSGSAHHSQSYVTRYSCRACYSQPSRESATHHWTYEYDMSLMTGSVQPGQLSLSERQRPDGSPYVSLRLPQELPCHVENSIDNEGIDCHDRPFGDDMDYESYWDLYTAFTAPAPTVIECNDPFGQTFSATTSHTRSWDPYPSGSITTTWNITVTKLSGGQGGPQAVTNLSLAKPFALSQNSPNPSIHGTLIRFSLSHARRATLTVYDVTGRAVKILLDEELLPGTHVINWKAEVPAGTYFYRLTAGDFTATKRMTVVR